MPPLKPVSQVLKTQLQWSDSADSLVTTTLYFRYTGSAPSSGDCAAFAQDLINAFEPHQAVWPFSVALIGATVVDLTSSTAFEGAATADLIGGDAGANLAGGTCTVVNYQIARRYRGGKPRSYLPWGTSASLNTRQSWTNTYIGNALAAVQAAIAQFVGTQQSSTTIQAHVNVSYYEGSRVVESPTTGRARNVPIPRDSPLVNDVVNTTVAVSPGTQRRRNR